MNFKGLLEPQKSHAVKLLDSLYVNGVAADLSETGCGKSYVAAWIAKNLNVPVTIIAPKVVLNAWNNVLTEFDIKPHAVINYEKLVRGNSEYLSFKNNCRINGTDDYVFNLPKNGLVIIDECHRCKGTKSCNSELLIALKKNNYKLLLLSATAATSPLEMKAFGYATTLHNLYNFRNFAINSGAYVAKYNWMKFDASSTKSIKAMSNIHTQLFDNFGVASRMTRKMFKNVFPDNHILPECFDLGVNTDKINRVYEVMELELSKLEQKTTNYSEHHFAIMTKARRKIELLKVPAIVESVIDLYEEGISPVIFVNYTDTVFAINNLLQSTNSKFKDTIAHVVGGQSAKARQNDVDDFQSDKKRIMIVNTAAGGVGLSLHDLNGNHPRHTIISPTWSAINMLQIFGRCHRALAKTPVTQKIFFAANTIEQNICRNVKSKLSNLDVLNDNDLNISLLLNF